MVAINDATVVSSAYDTSGNGGRKLVRLKSGNQYAAMKNGTAFYIYKTTDNYATTPTQFKTGSTTGFTDIALATDGTYLFRADTANGGLYFYSYKEDGTLIGGAAVAVDSNQTTLGNVSLVVNETGTEISAAWASKHTGYPNSFNIRYAKGTINADGTVSWGAVILGTSVNTSGYDVTNPVVLYVNGNPKIIAQYKTTASYYIRQYSISGNTFALDATIIDSGNVSYVQSNPSALFVPKSINGLTNGRVWVAWQGLDVTNTINPQLRMAYSDDNGATWTVSSTMINNISSPSITVNKINEIFVVYNQNTNNLYWSKINQTNLTTYANNLIKTPSGAPNPSALVDLSLNFSSPLYIYKDTAKVGFYGTWTVITISVAPGSLGLKDNRGNLLTYTITTDGSMSTITESVNGTVINTRTATSGQSLDFGLGLSQWDAVKYGKYADATGGKNTLTVSMGPETWTYTFDKRLATDADVLSAVKAVQDSQNAYLPSIKKQLVDKVGGVTSDSFENIIKNAAMGKKWASGTVTPVATAIGFEKSSDTSTNLMYSVTVSGLTFTPSYIILQGAESMTIYRTDGAYYNKSVTVMPTISSTGAQIYDFKADVGNAYVNSTGFKLPVFLTNPFRWIAFE